MPAPEKLTIDTPEQIALEYPLAGAGSRFLALAIDSALQALGFLVIAALVVGAFVVASTGFRTLATWMVAILVVCGFALYYGYFAAFEALWGGQTPGKRAIGLRVITVSGQPITVFDALLRNLLRIVDQLPGIYAVGIVTVFFNARNQRLGDIVAGTVVVQEEGLAQRAAGAPRTSEIRLGVARLRVEELEVIETFLSRRADLPDHLRARTAGTLADRIRERLSLTRASHPDDEQLIEAVAAEFRGGRARPTFPAV